MKKILLYKLALFLGLLANPAQALAQVSLPEELRPSYIPAREAEGTTEQQIQSLVGDLLTTAMFLTGGLAIVLIIITGIRYSVSFGQEDQTSKAKKSLIWIIVGLLALFTSLVLIRFVVQVVVGIQEF